MSLKKQIIYVVSRTLTMPMLFYAVLYVTDIFGAAVPLITYLLQVIIGCFVFYKCIKKATEKDGKSASMWFRIAIACIIWSIAVCVEPAFIKNIGKLTAPSGPYGAWILFPMRTLAFMIIYSVLFLSAVVIISHRAYEIMLRWERADQDTR